MGAVVRDGGARRGQWSVISGQWSGRQWAVNSGQGSGKPGVSVQLRVDGVVGVVSRVSPLQGRGTSGAWREGGRPNCWNLGRL